MLGFTIVGPEHRGRAAQARHLDAAARRARHPRRAGPVLVRDHPLLPDRGAATASTGGRRWSRRSSAFLAMAGACYLLIDNRGGSRAPATPRSSSCVPWVVLVDVPGRHGAGAVPAQPRARDATRRSAASCATRTPRRRRPGMSTLDAAARVRPSARAADAPRRSRAASRDPEGREGARRDRALRVRHAARAAQGRRAGRRGACRARRSSCSTSAPSATTYEAVVSLDRRARSSRGRTSRACSRRSWPRSSWPARRLVQADPRLAGGDAQARRRGLLAGDDRPVGGGLHGPEDDAAGARRIVRPLTWVRSAPGENGYARPVEGLIVECRPRRDGGRRGRRPRRRPAAAQGRQLRRRAHGRARTTSRASTRRATDLKPIEITQPEGAELHGRRPRA